MTVALRNAADLAEICRDLEARYASANGASGALFARACRGMPGGNTRSLLYFHPFPLTLTRGDGAHVWDADGHRYADYVGEYGAGLFGHSDPVIAAALKKAVDGGLVLGGPGEDEARLAELLCERFPSLDSVRFCNSGTEANLYAFGTARVHTGRRKIMVFEGAYHGGCFIFTTGEAPLNAPFPFVVAPYNDIEATFRLIERNATELAAVVIEPMLGAGGSIPADPSFLRALREAASRHGIVLIFDEVITSRLSAGGLQARLGITPDMTTLGKYIGGGSSFGAFGGRAEIMQRFDPRRPQPLFHAGTFNQDRLTMAAGHAGMAQVYTPEAARVFNEKGETLRRRLADVIARHGAPMQVTGQGSIMTVHFTTGPIRSAADVAGADPMLKHLFHLEMLARGQYVTPRGLMLCSLPMGEPEFDGLVAAFDGFVSDRTELLTER